MTPVWEKRTHVGILGFTILNKSKQQTTVQMLFTIFHKINPMNRYSALTPMLMPYNIPWTDVNHSDSSSFTFSIYISGVQHFGWDFCVCDWFGVFLIQPLMKSHSNFVDGACWVCFCCQHSPIYDINVRIFWVRVMECMCVQTRLWFMLSSERVLGEWSQNPC